MKRWFEDHADDVLVVLWFVVVFAKAFSADASRAPVLPRPEAPCYESKVRAP